jgi:hypothetical protein
VRCVCNKNKYRKFKGMKMDAFNVENEK